MQRHDLRLRLVIRRHGIPDVNLLWPCSTSRDMTIAKLLEQVDEVVPLESGEWGLEDYTVELENGPGGAFECLHFQTVSQVLKDEDRVIIRSLLSDDIKRRRLSGRHQISTGGKHLVDGIAFGRPWLRTPQDRPAIELPPRKRARLASYEPDENDDDDDDDEYANSSGQSTESDYSEYEEEDEADTQDRLLLEGPDTPSHNEDASSSCQSSPSSSLRPVRGTRHDRQPQSRYISHGRARNYGLIVSPTHRRKRPAVSDSESDSESEGDLEAEQDAMEDDLTEEARYLQEENETLEATPIQELKNLFDQDLPISASDQSLDGDEDDEGDDEHPTLISRDMADFFDEHPRIEDVDRRKSPTKPVDNLSPNEIEVKVESLPPILRLHLEALQAAFALTNPLIIQTEFLRNLRSMDIRKLYDQLSQTEASTVSCEAMMNTIKQKLPEIFNDGHGLDVAENHGLLRPKPLIQVLPDSEISSSPDEDASNQASLVHSGGNDGGVVTTPSNLVDGKEALDCIATKTHTYTAVEGAESEEDSDDEDDEDYDNNQGVDISAGDQFMASSDDSSGSSSNDDSESSDDDSELGEVKDGKASNAKPSGGVNNKSGGESDSDSSSESDSDSESGSDSDSGSDSGSDSDGDDLKSCSKLNPESNLMVEVGSDSDSSSGSSNSNTSRSKPKSLASKERNSLDASKSAAEVQPRDVTTLEESVPVPPGQGLTKTQKRNARRRRRKLGQQTVPETETSDLNNDLQARKQRLLSLMADSGVDEGNSPAPLSMGGKDLAADGSEALEDVEAPEELTSKENPADKATAAQSEKRRSRLDVGAGARLVFGALGHKAPKSKADREKIKENLMKNVKPLKNPRIEIVEDVSGQTPDEGKITTEEDSESWKDKIIYRAVECCQEGIELSNPPFPFVQRWDPQQKFNNFRKRKHGSDHYQEEPPYQDDSYGDHFEDVDVGRSGTAKKANNKQNKKKGKQADDLNHYNEDITLNYDDAPTKSSQSTDWDDLPSLPKNIESLKLLKQGQAERGMVITWKQLTMSKATKWQPELLSVTGMVLDTHEDGSLHVILAKRDREKDDKEFDEETGQRVYGKFEAPDLEESVEEDSGSRMLNWDDLVAPRVLQSAPPANAAITSSWANGKNFPGDSLAETVGEGGHEDVEMDLEVSDFQTCEGSALNELDTAQVRDAIVEELLQGMLNGELGASEPPTTLSDQQIFSRPNSVSVDEVAVNSSNDGPRESAEKRGTDVSTTLDDPSIEESSGAASPSKQLTGVMGGGVVGKLNGTSTNREIELLVGQGEEQAERPNSELRVEPSDAEPSEDEDRGGRQPEPALGDGDIINDDGLPDALPRLRDLTPISSVQPTSLAATSSSPFPSVEEIISTATSSRQTQSPGRLRTKPSYTSKSTMHNDREYEKAMKRLDEAESADEAEGEGEEEDTGAKSQRASLKSALPAPNFNDSQSQAIKAEPSSFANTTKTKTFAVPQGSQVIVLSSSPPSSPQSGDRATRQGSGSPSQDSMGLPTGPGWARKGRRRKHVIESSSLGEDSDPDAGLGKRFGVGSGRSKARRFGRR